MMCRALATMCIVATVLAAGNAGAGSVFSPGDSQLFAGLIPGERLSGEELGTYYGTGVAVSINLADGTALELESLQFGNNGSTINSADTVSLSNTSTFSDNQGIFQNIPVSGDNNQVVVNVNITVNLNTVTVADSAGASIIVNQTLDFNGAISALD